MWPHHLPPESNVVGRYLARQIQCAGGSRWATLHPQRFVELVRKGDADGLELRLQLEYGFASTSLVGEIGTNKPAVKKPLNLPTPSCTPGLPPQGPNYGFYNTPSGSSSFFSESIHLLTVDLSPQSAIVPPPDLILSSPMVRIGPSPDLKPSSTPSAFDRGVAAFLAGKHTESRERFQQAAYEFHERGDVHREADCLRHLGMSSRRLEDYVAARSHLLTARAMYESLGAECRQEQLRCTRHLARVEEDSGNDQLALLTYQELLRTTEREKLVTQHAWCSYYLGHLYNRMKRYREALNILKDVFNTSREIRNGEIEGFATEESGYTAERQGHPQLAMSCYEKALQLFKTHGEGRWIENENRVEERMRQLSQGFPMLFKKSALRRRPIGAKMLNRD
ncbi:hypothetical protein FRC06_000929 [Ceratobasidium sp. 370]|nr:hypothetical protein FRC06_000929 [Ceratobasidium sp. 370]